MTDKTDMSLRDAAQAAIDRWETPLWKDAPATAVFIADLRDALARDAGHAAALCRLHTENEALRAGYDAARLEIESLREREQLARDVNSRRVTELEAQLGRWGGWR